MFFNEKSFLKNLTPIILFTGLLLFSGCLGKLPSKEELKNISNHTASEIYSSDSILLGRYFIENRTNVRFEEIPPHFINALIATEDARFYHHEGVDSRSMLRVLFKTILLQDESSGGGSTLSQQLAKNLYKRKPGRFEMLRNKIREAMIAGRLEEVYSKEELLTLYLNTVSFGEEVYGIETAAERFFNVKPKDLTVAQSATLVGLLKAPTHFNPRVYPDRALQRRNVVVAQMEKYGYLESAVADSLRSLSLELEYHKITHDTGLAPFFREMARLRLMHELDAYNQQHGTNYNLYTDGLKIYTTLHSRMQLYAENAVKNHLADLQKTFDNHWKSQKPWDANPNLLKDAVQNSERYKNLKKKGLNDDEIETNMNTPVEMRQFSYLGEEIVTLSPLDSIQRSLMWLQAGMLALNPRNGHVMVWVGGIEYAFFKYDHVTSSRQVGSTFKPIVYAAALENGMQPCERFPNELVTYENYEDWTPRNSNGQYGGLYSLQGALTHSINTISAQVIMEVGVDKVMETAAKAGVTGKMPAVPSLALGTAELSLLEMTNVFATFANSGIHTAPKFLLKILNKEGSALLDNTKPTPTQLAMERTTARAITYFLQSAVDSGTGNALRNQYHLTNDIAGKTGTTQDQTDGWFIGYTPDLVCGVWVGADNPQIRFRTSQLGQGSKMALPVWGLFMQELLNDKHFSYMKKSAFPNPEPSLLAQLDCPMYKEKISFWEKLFGNKKDDKSKPEPSRKKAEEQKSSVKDRIKKFFGKKEK